MHFRAVRPWKQVWPGNAGSFFRLWHQGAFPWCRPCSEHRAMIRRASSRWLTWCRCLLLQRHAAAGTEHSTEVRPFVELFQIKLGEKSNETPKRPCGRRSATYNSLGRRRNILYLPCNKNPLLGAVARFLKTLSLYVSKTYRLKSSL